MKNNKYATLWLATLPITGIYMFPYLPFSIGEVLFFFLFLSLLRKNSIRESFKLPHFYLWFWAYSAITFALGALRYGGTFSAILPGGFAFFLFSIQLGICSRWIDIGLLHKYLKYLSFLIIAVLLLQEFSFFAYGHRFSALVPFLNMTDGLSARELADSQMTLDRSCSILREPAHIATFLLVPLILELFWHSPEKLFTKYSIILIFGLLITRSGNGFLALMLVLCIKIVQYNRTHYSIKNKIFLAFAILLAVVGAAYYIKTEQGAVMLARTSEFERSESSKSYVRIYRGFDLFAELPKTQKIFGINNPDGVFELTKYSKSSYLFDGDKEADLYFNCISRVLIFLGIVGFCLLLFISIRLYKNNFIWGRVLLLVFFILSFIGQLYITPFMLTIYSICTNCQIHTQNEKNSLLRST